MELATVQARDPPVACGDRRERFLLLGRVAGGWLNFGEAEKPCPLIREGLVLIRFRGSFEQKGGRSLCSSERGSIRGARGTALSRCEVFS